MKREKDNIIIKHVLITIGILILINIVYIFSEKYFTRIDLTSEKRYTVSEETRQILDNLNDVVYIKIYLDGELTIPYEKFQKSIIELLDEFKIYGDEYIQYQLIDPFKKASPKQQKEITLDMYKRGFNPQNLPHTTDKVIFPCASIIYKELEIPLNLYTENPKNSIEEDINNSIESLEYNLISTIKNAITKEVPKLVFIEGHGEWPDIYVDHLFRELSKSYQIDRGKINGRKGILNPYKAVIIAGPILEFPEADKFVIDQYVMNGGKILWLLDAVNVNFDSLANGYSLGLPNNLNIEDMLFKYGVRINYNMIQDIQCGTLPINTELSGNAPKFKLMPWLYYPLISVPENNVITRNINLVYSQFASSIDTIKARKNIKKTPLLVSSYYTKLREAPALIELKESNFPPEEKEFNAPNQVLGILLEGKFESVFKNRMVGDFLEQKPEQILEESKATKMIVIADADIIRNDIKQTPKGPVSLPLGYDKYIKRTYGNKDFLVNAINYLTNETGIMELRGRNFKLRLLNKQKIAEERIKWQIINLIFPILIIVCFGIIFSLIRKIRYTRD